MSRADLLALTANDLVLLSNRGIVKRAQREVGDRRAGWLNEISWDPSLNFRLGVGYNFTTFSGDPLETGPESSHGWFVRAQSRY